MLWGEWYNVDGDRYETVSIRSALVSVVGAASLLAAVQTGIKFDRFALPYAAEVTHRFRDGENETKGVSEDEGNGDDDGNGDLAEMLDEGAWVLPLSGVTITKRLLMAMRTTRLTTLKATTMTTATTRRSMRAR